MGDVFEGVGALNETTMLPEKFKEDVAAILCALRAES